MKVFGKRTLTIDCSWELENDSKLRPKLESFTDEQLINYSIPYTTYILFSKGVFY